VRPSSGGTPSTAKSSAETICPTTNSGSPDPDNVNPVPMCPATASKERVRRSRKFSALSRVLSTGAERCS
jgi:hypothetical protein